MAEGVQAAGPRKFTIQMPKASTLRTDVDIWIVPADGHYGCQLEETTISVHRCFLSSSSDKSRLPVNKTMGMLRIKNN